LVEVLFLQHNSPNAGLRIIAALGMLLAAEVSGLKVSGSVASKDWKEKADKVTSSQAGVAS
jgi:hypothetical protein